MLYTSTFNETVRPSKNKDPKYLIVVQRIGYATGEKRTNNVKYRSSIEITR